MTYVASDRHGVTAPFDQFTRQALAFCNLATGDHHFGATRSERVTHCLAQPSAAAGNHDNLVCYIELIRQCPTPDARTAAHAPLIGQQENQRTRDSGFSIHR